MKFIFLSLTCFYTAVCGQTNSSKIVDVSAAQAYIKIAKQLESGDSEKTIQWAQLFDTKPCQMMIRGGVVDTVAFKADMSAVYRSNPAENKSLQRGRQFYHNEYRENLHALEQYIIQLATADVVDSVRQTLYPLLPERLQSADLFPKLFYLYYGSADATGNSGLVLNDLLLSYKIDNYKFGVLASHEAFHAIVSVAFQQKLKANINYDSPEFNLLYLMEMISEEGVADLIDKPILGQKGSPVYATVEKLRNNDTILSITCLQRLDSLLTQANASGAILNNYASFQSLSSQFGQNGGHIPGRFMGLVIKEGKRLDNQIQSIEDPVSFFLNYNHAAITLKQKKYPVFSEASVDYLKKLKRNLLKE
ncbi:DUF5700 domain-containing putative Zn-dependent protease [Chitinophaga sp. OAE865]|uniref:DUF5700 domain-containing putative Zn-dependent protease n=1 Tax=Chitinophaga sp. OAE865 TaxID=2817898 RepID=UPI001AE40073